MSRVINTSGPGKRRNQQRRTIAEILRHLMLKRNLDDEAKDMAATLVLALREIAETVEQSTVPWEKRNYFLKADRFRRKWEWATIHADRLARLVMDDGWDAFPKELAMLAPYFKDVRVVKFTRQPSAWQGNHSLLKQQGQL
jgi:hypothetical protein